ncbi:MAG: formimidoylglutamase [Pseudomonadota bacterium]
MHKLLTRPQWPGRSQARWSAKIIDYQRAPESLHSLNQAWFSVSGKPFFGLALLGLADDEGVRLNGGRPGARLGPDAFRQALAAYGAAGAIALNGLELPVFDVGNICPAATLDETHSRISQIVSELLQAGLMPIGVGGGHDLTFPVVRSVINELASPGQPLDGVYFDAHLDVREQAGSGMPFRRLIEHGGIGKLHVLGMDALSNTVAHLRWFENNGGHLAAWSPSDWPQSSLQFVSICLDVVDMAQAPGVSAPAPVGWSAARLAEYAEAAGRNPAVCCFDIMELCPPHDEKGRTARLAAHLFLRFLAGLNQRIADQQGAA